MRYGEDGTVHWAHFTSPYGTKGMLPGHVEPLERRFRVAEQRLAQMKRIQAEFERRFGK